MKQRVRNSFIEILMCNFWSKLLLQFEKLSVGPIIAELRNRLYRLKFGSVRQVARGVVVMLCLTPAKRDEVRVLSWSLVYSLDA